MPDLLTYIYLIIAVLGIFTVLFGIPAYIVRDMQDYVLKQRDGIYSELNPAIDAEKQKRVVITDNNLLMATDKRIGVAEDFKEALGLLKPIYHKALGSLFIGVAAIPAIIGLFYTAYINYQGLAIVELSVAIILCFLVAFSINDAMHSILKLWKMEKIEGHGVENKQINPDFIEIIYRYWN
jgi:hypothetical protein